MASRVEESKLDQEWKKENLLGLDGIEGDVWQAYTRKLKMNNCIQESEENHDARCRKLFAGSSTFGLNG